MISAHLTQTADGRPMVKLTNVVDNVTQRLVITPDDAAFLFFDLDDVLKELRQRMPAPQ